MAARGNIYGFFAAQFYRVNSSGFGIGQLDPLSLTPGATSSAYRVAGAVSAGLPQPTYETVTFRGNQRILGQADLGISDLGSFDMQISEYDATLMSLLLGGNVDTTTITSSTVSSPNYGRISPYQVGIMLTAGFQSRDAATSGVNSYITYVIPLAQVRITPPGLSQDGGVNPNLPTLTITPSFGGRFPNGVAFGANQTWENNESLIYGIQGDAPYSYTCFIQNNSDTTYTLGYRPTTSTTNQTDHLWAVGGTITAPTSVVTSTGVVTLAAAGTSGVIAAGLYKTNFVAI